MKVCIIGAGPAGLTFADKLLDLNSKFEIDILEKSTYIGGISKTVNYKGNRIDIGGHRFFSKSDEVMNWWANKFPIILEKNINGNLITYQNKTRTLDGFRVATEKEIKEGNVMLLRSRKSRILYQRKLYDYPLKLNLKTIKNIGFRKMFKVVISYLYSKIYPKKPNNLEEFIISKFGKELYKMFFETYTEKVWGQKPVNISVEWGAQRIKGLSIRKILFDILKKSINSLKSKKNDQFISQKNVETSLIERFLYPKYGPGQMWELVSKKLISKGVNIIMKSEVIEFQINANGDRINKIKYKNQSNEIISSDYDFIISTMPIKDLYLGMKNNKGSVLKDPKIFNVAKNLPYRDFITVGVLLDKISGPNSEFLDDNWIYIQENDVKVGRIQIFNNWSPYLVANPEKIWIGLEYFCDEEDNFWNNTDNEIIEIAKKELINLKLCKKIDINDATLIRERKTYPAYFGSYKDFDLVKNDLNGISNLFCIGRNGMHKYNNQDHSMLTAIRAAELLYKNNTDASEKENLWLINTEQEYHEEK